MTTLEFWRSASMLPRAALVVAVVATAINIGTYVGLSMSMALGVFALPHLAVIALGFVLFARIWRHNLLAFRRPKVLPDPNPLPVPLVRGAVFAGVYLVVLFFGTFAIYGEGNAEFQDGKEVWRNGSVVRALAPGSVALFEDRMLRVFSAGWFFFGLLIALSDYRYEERIRIHHDAGVKPRARRWI